jgi:hypothetical protein
MGHLPLHKAAVSNTSLEVVKLLYDSWPEAARGEPQKGRQRADAAAFRGWVQSFLGSGQVPL